MPEDIRKTGDVVVGKRLELELDNVIPSTPTRSEPY